MTAKSFHLQSAVRGTWLLSFCLGLFCSVTISAQSTPTPNQPPGVSVLECKWEKVRRHDSSTPVIEPPKTDDNTGQVKPPNDNSDLRRSNVNVPFEVSENAMYSYSYSIKVKNAGAKKVRSMAWDYVFSDPGSKSELRRDSLRSFEQVSVSETKWIRLEHLPTGPPRMVTAAGLKKNQRSPFDERIEIKCLLYTDGTGWRAPDAEPKTCDDLVKFTLHPLRHGVYR